MNEKIREFVKLIRLYPMFSTFIVSSSIVTTSYVLNSSQHIINLEMLFLIITTVFSLTIATAASNVLNQITDIKEDEITKPYRPIPSGKISIRKALIICIIFYVIASIISFLINLYFSLFTLLFIIFTITYSIYPRVKKFFIINQLWIGIARGCFLILASWSVFSNPLEKMPLALSIISCIFIFGGMSSKDIFDAKADTKTGVKTLVNVIGLQKTATLSLFFMTGSILLIIPFILLDIFKLIHLPLLFFIIPVFYIYVQMKNSKKYKVFENVAAWVIMHATNFLFIFCFAILTIIFS